MKFICFILKIKEVKFSPTYCFFFSQPSKQEYKKPEKENKHIMFILTTVFSFLYYTFKLVTNLSNNVCHQRPIPIEPI